MDGKQPIERIQDLETFYLLQASRMSALEGKVVLTDRTIDDIKVMFSDLKSRLETIEASIKAVQEIIAPLQG